MNQANVATFVGLVLAAIQFTLLKQFLRDATYRENAFLGVGTAWVYLAPAHASSLFVDHSPQEGVEDQKIRGFFSGGWQPPSMPRLPGISRQISNVR